MKARFFAGGREWELGRPSQLAVPPGNPDPAPVQRSFLRSCRGSTQAIARLRSFLADECRIQGISKWPEAEVLAFLSRQFAGHALRVNEILHKDHKPGAIPRESEPEMEPVEEFRPNNEPAFSMKTVVELEEPPEMETESEIDEGPEMETGSQIEESPADTEGDSEITEEARTEPAEFAEDMETVPVMDEEPEAETQDQEHG